MQSEWNKGAAYCRDCILANIIGIQNDIGCDESKAEYKILQKLLLLIEEQYGKQCDKFTG